LREEVLSLRAVFGSDFVATSLGEEETEGEEGGDEEARDPDDEEDEGEGQGEDVGDGIKGEDG